MKTKTTAILISSFLLFGSTGCKSILMKMYGIKKPSTENEQTILQFAGDMKLRTDNIVTVNAPDFFQVLKQAHSIPEADVFDANGDYIEYRKTDSSCNAGLFGFIPNLTKENKYNKTGKTTLQTQLSHYRDLKGNPLDSIAPADFYVLIYWTTWSGKLNKNHVKVWEDYAKANKKASIKVIKVNLDFQEYWNSEDRDGIIQKIEKRQAS